MSPVAPAAGGGPFRGGPGDSVPPLLGEMQRHTQRSLNDGWLLLFGVPLVGFLLPQVAGMREGLGPAGALFWLSVVHGSVVAGVIWVSLRDWGRRRHLFSVGASSPRLGWTGYVLISAGAGYACAFGGAWLWYRVTGLPVDWSVCERCGWISLILVCAMTQYYLCLYVRADLDFASVRAAELRDTTRRIHLQSTTCRQEPEAVLGALAVLRGLVETSPAAAVRHAQSIALVYRYVLRESTRELVILRDELALLERHADLLAARCGRALRVEIRIETGQLDRFLVVPVTLHALLESAAQSARPTTQTPQGLTVALRLDGARLRFEFGPTDGTFDTLDTEAYRALDARITAIVGVPCIPIRGAGATSVSVPLLPITH